MPALSGARVSEAQRSIRNGALVALAAVAVVALLRQLIAHDLAELVGRLWVQSMSVVLGMLAAFFPH